MASDVHGDNLKVMSNKKMEPEIQYNTRLGIGAGGNGDLLDSSAAWQLYYAMLLRKWWSGFSSCV